MKMAEAGVGRPGAQLAQWALYVAGCAVLGLPWMIPVYGVVSIVGAAVSDVPYYFAPAGIVIASLCGGILYRLAAIAKNRPPSLWFALLLPGIAVVASFAVAGWWVGIDQITGDGLGLLMGTLMTTYVCGGIVLIPLSVPHVLGYRWLHLRLNAWAPQARSRAIRHVGYGVACGCLLFATEGNRLLTKRETMRVAIAADQFGLSMPAKTSLLDASEKNTYPFTARFRTDAKFRWPENAKALSKPLSDAEAIQRLEPFVHRANPRLRYVSQAKWTGEYGQSIQGIRLRTEKGDFLAFTVN